MTASVMLGHYDACPSDLAQGQRHTCVQLMLFVGIRTTVDAKQSEWRYAA